MPAVHTVREAYARAVLRLSRAGVASPESEAWQFLEAATGRSRSELMIYQRSLDPGELRLLGEWLVRRELREPLQLILGRTWFYGLEIPLRAGVLVPRPETERLVEISLTELHEIPAPRVLDVGTGSGAVALALKSERPDAAVVATDLDPLAVEAAAASARLLGLEIEFHRSDLLDDPAVAELARRADAIVSNPPYLPVEDREQAVPEVRWDPAEALYAGEDGLAVFRRLMSQAHSLLAPGAVLIVELDPRNVDPARSEASDWSTVEVHEDLVGRRRFLLLRR